MFDQARLKLTLWYLLIIMSISVSFSIFIYRLLQNEIKRIAVVQQELMEGQYEVPEATSSIKHIPLVFDQEILDDSRKRILYVLFMVNGAVLIISGGLGYLLAGETLKPIQDMVEDQNRFISDASHELRTPLTALKSTMEVTIRDKRLTLAEAKTVIEESISEVDKLHKLSDDLLKLARSQHTNEVPYFKKVELDKILQQASRKVTALAAKKKIKIEISAPKQSIEAEPDTLQQVFVIALDNAIKYSPSGTSVQILSQKKKDVVEVSVIDQGVGIARRDIPHIFDRFYRTDNARSKTDTGGYGLGLSIAQQIMIAHHGRIVVRSKPKHGTTLIFVLPVTHAKTA